ncbi:MAG: tripartite tricarboxylate transporter substrate binding protein [Burkholderiales bacterium]
MRFGLWTAAVALLVIAPVVAQSYPVKPVRLIVPFPPGGSIETLARLLGGKLSEMWGQQIIIDNRPGASGVIGTELGAKAAPDGYTLLMGSGAPLTIVPGFNPKLPYDPIKDFAPITNVAAVPNVFALHPSVPVNDVKGLIALARARPDQLTFATNGAGSPGHLAGELLKSMAGARMTHVPYKGAAPATLAVVSGEVSMTITTTPAVLPQAKAGRLKIIAVTTLQRLPPLPEIPTVAESGLPGYEAVSWFGLVAPAAVAPDLLKKIYTDALQALGAPDMRGRIAILGATPIGNTPAQFRAQISDDLAKWARIIKASGAKPD